MLRKKSLTDPTTHAAARSTATVIEAIAPALLYNLVPAFNPGARIGIVDAFGPTSEHGTPPDLLRRELAAAGYREISFDRLTGSNAYLTVFAPPPPASRPRPDAMVACKAR